MTLAALCVGLLGVSGMFSRGLTVFGSGVTGALWAEPQTTPTSHWTFLELPFEPLMHNKAQFSGTTSLYFTLPPQQGSLLIK